MIAGHVVVDPPRDTPHGARVKLRVIVVGRDRGEPLCEIADEYLGRPVDAVQAQLSAMAKDGSLAEIATRWFGADITIVK